MIIIKAVKCNTCKHPELSKINEQIIAGVSPQQIAEQYDDLHYKSIERHAKNHLPEQLVKAKRLGEEDAADDLLVKLEQIYDRAWLMVDKAETNKSYAAGVSALKECRSCLELTGKLIGTLRSGHVTNIYYSPQWMNLRGTIYNVLEKYPEAKLELAAALREVEEDDIIDA